VQQLMKLRRNRQQNRPEPQREHQTGNGALANTVLAFGGSPKLHFVLIDHGSAPNASDFVE